MKKILTIIMTALCILCLFGCQKVTKETEETANNETVLAGGWETVDKEIDAELQDIFDKAMQGYVGMNLKPLKLVGTQIVAGRNYRFYCEGSAVVLNPEIKNYFVTVYQDLNGNCSILEVVDA